MLWSPLLHPPCSSPCHPREKRKLRRYFEEILLTFHYSWVFLNSCRFFQTQIRTLQICWINFWSWIPACEFLRRRHWGIPIYLSFIIQLTSQSVDVLSPSPLTTTQDTQSKSTGKLYMPKSLVAKRCNLFSFQTKTPYLFDPQELRRRLREHQHNRDAR